MNELDGLFSSGDLKKVSPSREKAEKSVQNAERYLEKAKKVFDQRMDDVAVLLAYSAAFHAARAVLFSEGVSERSHYAVAAYLRERHAELGRDTTEAFDLYRRLRHAVAYGLDTKVGPKESLGAIQFAEDIIKRVKKLL